MMTDNEIQREYDRARSALATKLREPVGEIVEKLYKKADSDRPDYNEGWCAALDELSATLAHQPVTVGWTPTHRHVKRGSEYRVISEMAQIQASKDDPLTDYELAVIYQGKDGQYWVRRRSEFNDGRFAALKSEGRK